MTGYDVSDIIEHMFESRVQTASAAGLLDLARDTQADHKRTGCQKLVVAAAWADVHSHVDHPAGPDGDEMAGERLVAMGPVGCPEVAENAPTELALAFQTSIGGAKSVIRDALNLRHRLPRIWARIEAGELHDWKARQIAQRTAHLGVLPAREVDRLIVNHIELVAWRRLERMLDATLLHVDAHTYRDRADQATNRRDVWATESSDGLRTLIARCDAGDISIFLALVNRIADALADDGDEDPVAVRRAKAIGIAGYPDRALDLLLRHRHDADSHLEPWQRSSSVDPDTVGGRETQYANPTDPWDPGPPGAGWQTADHGNYHQPDPGDPDYHASHGTEPDGQLDPDHEAPDPTDLSWLHDQAEDSAAAADNETTDPAGPSRRYANAGGINLAAALAAFAHLDADALDKARPNVVIHLHLTDDAIAAGPTSRGVIRTAYGPITIDQLRRFLGDTGATIAVHPVLDPAGVAPVDGYEIPLAMRRAVTIRHPTSVFPFSPSLSDRADLDHTRSYRTGGPPGQTAVDKLGPLARCEHRPKTHGRMQARQPEPGTYLWRSPHRWISIVTNQGTLTLGDTPFARSIWAAAQESVIPAA